MIITTHCMTCGQVIGHLWEQYTILVKKYTKEQDENHKKGINKPLDPDHPDKTARGKALDDIGLVDVCCRTSMLAHINITDRLRNRYQDI